jgi:ribose transport system permease protein
VTLAAMFIIQGLTLLVMGKPGGFVAPSLGGAYMGDAVANVLPASIVMIGVTVLLWLWLKRTPFGLALYAVGSDPEAAEATGLRTHWVVLPPMFWLAGCTGWQGFLSTPKPGRVIRWLVIPCRCQPLRRS